MRQGQILAGGDIDPVAGVVLVLARAAEPHSLVVRVDDLQHPTTHGAPEIVLLDQVEQPLLRDPPPPKVRDQPGWGGPCLRPDLLEVIQHRRLTYNPDARTATIVLDDRGDEFLTASIYSDRLDRWRIVDAGTKKWMSKSSVYRLYDHKIDHVNIDDLWAI